MNRLKRFLEQGVIAYAAFLLCEGIVEYIPCPEGKLCELMNCELKKYERNREGN
jgi:hypothetical protein